MVALQTGSDTEGHPPRAPHDGCSVYPCSQAQQRFWFEEQLHPQNPGLNVAVRWRLDGEVSTSVLNAAWQQLVARHESLRTRFERVDGEPVQIVEPRVPFAVRIVDLSEFDAAAVELEAERLAVLEARVPFDLSAAPLLRVSRVIQSATRSTLLVSAHHTVCDGWSVGILAREMATLCAALTAGERGILPALPTTYGRFAQAERDWLRAGALDDEAALLRERLRDYKQFELLTDHPRPAVQTANGAIVSVLLEREVTAALGTIARENGSTLFMVSLAALLALFHRYTNETDITLGTQVVGRDEVDLEGIVGCFINTIAIRNDVSNDPTFVELLERARDTVTDTFDVRHFPLERLIEVVNPKRDLSRNALFSVNFVFQRSFISDEVYGGFSLIDLPSRSAGALYDLNFFMVERPDGWRLSCEYNTDLFERQTVSDLIERLERVFRSVAHEPRTRISQILLLSAVERQELLAGADATAREYPTDRTVAELIAEQAAKTPHAPAVACSSAALTYAQLEAASNRLARELIARDFGARRRIGILLERSTDLVVALLAVLKSGSAYVPLDPAYPPERLAFIIENAGLAAIVSDASLNGRAVSPHTPFLNLDTDARAIEANSAESFPALATARDLAYVIYTSGSTGRPKGVEIEHRSLVNLLWSMARAPGLSAADVFVAVTTISFDIAGLEVFLPLVSGAQVVIADQAHVGDGRALLDLLRRSHATVMQATPVTWQLLIEAGWDGPPLKKILCGGEALTRKLADELLDRCSDVWNMYGPTETTIWSAALRVERGLGPVPIGGPIANTQFYIVDPRSELAPRGVAGELLIGGDGVARGYLERPELDRERFVADRFSTAPDRRLYRTGDLVRRRGEQLEFLGRSDQQIKLRGFRIELGEIEATLLQHAGVVDAAAVLREDDFGDKLISAFVVSTADNDSNQTWVDELRTALGQSLPHYMVPSRIIVLAALPRTPNGKLDRAALPHGTMTGTCADDSPASPTEITLAALIAEMLGRASVGRTNDIFALGVHSLLAVRLVSRIEKTFGVALPLRALFDSPTVAQLALRIDAPARASELAAPFGPIVTLNRNGRRTPLVFLHSDVLADGMYCRRLAAALGAAHPIHAIAPHGTAGLKLEPTVERMARDYLPRLRSVQPAGPYRLGGFCAGGLVAYELARLLREQGDTVEQLILINASASSNNAVRGGDRIIRAVGLNARLDPRLRESVCYNVARLYEALGEGPRGVAAVLGERVRALFARAERDTRTGMADFEPFEKRRGTPETENYFAHLVAALTFHPQRYDGELTLIWGMDQRTLREDPTIGWSAFTRSVRVVPIDGGHISPLHDRIEELGRVLGGILQ